MLGLVAAVSTVVVGHAPLSDQIRETTNYVRQVFNADACVVRELVGRRLLLVAHDGIAEGVLPHSMPSSLGIARRLLRRKKPLAISDVPHDPSTSVLHK